ncbi:hypothetical protein ACFL5Q_07955 [Planctomycetota bacterium]
MCRRPFLESLVLSAALVLLAVPSTAGAAEPEAPAPSETAEKEAPVAGEAPALERPAVTEAGLDSEAAFEQRLSRKIVLESIDTPLDWVLESVHDQTGVNIVIDRHALADVGVDGEWPVTFSIQGVPLRSGLELMLEPLGLTWTIRHGVLLVTTPEEAEDMAVTKVYDVADLVVFRDQNGEPWDDYDSLVETIATTIQPQAWDNGNAGYIHGGTFSTAKVLIVSHTREVHHEINRLLEDLRKAARQGPDDAKPPLKERPLWPAGYGGGPGMGLTGGGLTAGGQLPSSALGLGTWWLTRGSVAVVAEESVELKVGEKVLTTLKKGTKLPVLNVKGDWVGVSVSVDGKETMGWVRKTSIEPLPPAVAPETTVPSP